MSRLTLKAESAITRYQTANDALKQAIADEARLIAESKRSTLRKNEAMTERNTAREDMVAAIANASEGNA